VLAYILRRLLGMIPTLFIISVITFIIIQLPPGDFMTSLQAEVAATGGGQDAQTLEALRQRYGLDQPLYIQYFRWIAGFPRGDFGYSMEWNAPVWDLVAGRLAFTILLGGLALILMWVVAIPIGVYSATHQYTPADHTFTFLGFVGLSVPDFLLALIYMVVATLALDMSASGLYSSGMQDAPWTAAKILDLLKHLWAPVLILGLAGTAELIRIMRGSMLDVLGQQFITTARAKGVGPTKLLLKYPVRLALNPVISTIGGIFPQLVSGGAIVAMVLSLPTVGPLLLNAIMREDMYLAGSMLMVLSLLGVLGVLVSDLLLLVLDPRIRMGAGSR